MAEITSRAVATAERLAIERALMEGGGDAARAADRLQIGFKAFMAKMREHGIG
jgi:DNA-binding NtrC family response regulator